MNRSSRSLLGFGALMAALGGCTAPGGPGSEKNWNWGTTEINPAPVQPLVCKAAQTGSPMPARADIMSSDGMPAAGDSDSRVSTDELFNSFNANCGVCHVGANQGGFAVNRTTFADLVGQTSLDRIMSDDPATYMPPPSSAGRAFSSRIGNDPIFRLATLLQAWIAQGKPAVDFSIGPVIQPTGLASYAISPELGNSLTNLGDCIPDTKMVGTNTGTMDTIDAMFASTTALPDTLDKTDLTSFDGATLASLRVIAFAPQYPLWSDDAGKIRHIRVPRGQSVTLDKTRQQFNIPPNTRFYKTFLKKVIDRDGNETYRKIETRLIVARPDKTLPDGTLEPRALFGSYRWDDTETVATLENVPLHNFDPSLPQPQGFADDLFTYTTDEPREQMIRDTASPAAVQYQLANAHPPIDRHYAIPGSERCNECHEGSPSGSFVLGFTPLQISRRADGADGAYEPAGPDELTQLQRLIEYGVITGMTVADVTPLEKSEGTRPPRNKQELAAQAYMVGNCAHCHNPNGFPSRKSPPLKGVLDFLPSQTGGIFQFSLDTNSPLRQRGISQDVPIPYITPSLREYPVADPVNLETAQPGIAENWKPKWVNDCSVDSAQPDPVLRTFCGTVMRATPGHLSAPWRSLLYRNVDTPFMYADDFVVFPHMPMNTPGYDCRVKRIMGEWMVSIPSDRKKPSIAEDNVPGVGPYDDSPQPYYEVRPPPPGVDDPAYDVAVLRANIRLATFQQSSRYEYCPDASDDIVDPTVLPPNKLIPDHAEVPAAVNSGMLLQPDVGVPTHAHWVVTDLTDAPGPWSPRRNDWASILVEGHTDPSATASSEDAQLQVVLDTLSKVSLTDQIKTLALTEVPFGLWKVKSGCTFTDQRMVSSIPDAERPRWMTLLDASAADAPVFMESPGRAVFTNICINCHGPSIDAKGLLADAIANMTGGTARVADFRDGLFGPLATPGYGRHQVFGCEAADPSLLGVSADQCAVLRASGLTPEDWASRYLVWMALGGTKVTIPQSILSIVGTTPVLGRVRGKRAFLLDNSANMLQLARRLCKNVLLPSGQSDHFVLTDTDYIGALQRKGTFDWSDASLLIGESGDAEMWQRLCSLNQPVVRVAALAPSSAMAELRVSPSSLYAVNDPAAYPADAPVMDDRGRIVMGIHPDNLFPLCVQQPADATTATAVDNLLKSNLIRGAQVPYCPSSLFVKGSDGKAKYQFKVVSVEGSADTYPDSDAWASRGAVNAGLAVFAYLQQLEDKLSKGQPPPVSYDHCEMRSPGQ